MWETPQGESKNPWMCVLLCVSCLVRSVGARISDIQLCKEGPRQPLLIRNIVLRPIPNGNLSILRIFWFDYNEHREPYQYRKWSNVYSWMTSQDKQFTISWSWLNLNLCPQSSPLFSKVGSFTGARPSSSEAMHSWQWNGRQSGECKLGGGEQALTIAFRESFSIFIYIQWQEGLHIVECVSGEFL